MGIRSIGIGGRNHSVRAGIPKTRSQCATPTCAEMGDTGALLTHPDREDFSMIRQLRQLLSPQPLETASRNACVVRRVLGDAMAKVVLHRAQIRALVR